jgi:shikimate kinase
MPDPSLHVILIGPMGVGKTTVGVALARRLGWPFLDSDEVIEALRGTTGRDVVTSEGIEGLHRIELAVLERMVATPPCAVIASAESVVDSALGRDLLASQLAVRLTAPPEVLTERRLSGQHRRVVTAEEAAELARRRAGDLVACTIASVDTSMSVGACVARITAIV